MLGLRWAVGVFIVTSMQVLVTWALGGYPGTFYRIMMMLNKDRKSPRTAPSPNKLWAILDPPASLGSLGGTPLSTNRIIRSVEDFRNEELQRQHIDDANNIEVDPPLSRIDAEAETEANDIEAETKANGVEAETEANDAEAETETPEEDTEPPVTTMASLEWGGDLDMEINPNNLTLDDGRFFHQIIHTPGFDEGEYPENIEVKWNLKIGKDCAMGMMLFIVEEGHIRDSELCNQDYLQVVYHNGVASKYCGQVVDGSNKVSGNDIWTLESEVPRGMQLIFRSGDRSGSNSGGAAKGVKIEISAYCWQFSEYLLSRTTTTTESTTQEDEVVTVVAEDPVDDTTETPDGENETQAEAKEIMGDVPVVEGNADKQQQGGSVSEVLEQQEGSASQLSEQQQQESVPQASKQQEESVSQASEQQGGSDLQLLEEHEGSLSQESNHQEKPDSLLGGNAVDAGNPEHLLPGSSFPGVPIASAAVNPGGFIPIVPLRDSSKASAPSAKSIGTMPIVTHLQKKK